MMYRTVAFLMILTTGAYANVTFTLNTSSCRVTTPPTSAILSANWIDPTHTCTKSFDDSITNFDNLHFFGVNCPSQQSISKMWDAGGRNDCYCTETDTVGQAPMNTSIVLAPDCATRVTSDFWADIVCD